MALQPRAVQFPFGRWNPVGVLVGALFFGGTDALQFRLQALKVPVPAQFLLMLPYLLSVLALLSASGRGGAPAALTVPYAREED